MPNNAGPQKIKVVIKKRTPKKKETPVKKLAAAAKFHAKKPAPGADERGNVKQKATRFWTWSD
jgi:hypothetical protein